MSGRKFRLDESEIDELDAALIDENDEVDLDDETDEDDDDENDEDDEEDDGCSGDYSMLHPDETEEEFFDHEDPFDD